ncbi:MAG: hypothetical protein ACLS37_08245 [Alistipes sp.]
MPKERFDAYGEDAAEKIVEEIRKISQRAETRSFSAITWVITTKKRATTT